MASKHIKRSPSAHSLNQRNIRERENRGDDRAKTDPAEPEDLLSCFGVTFTTDPDVQSLINSDRTWLVTWIGWHRAMAHLHELDLLELCQLFWVGRDFALSRCRRGRGSGHGFVG